MDAEQQGKGASPCAVERRRTPRCLFSGPMTIRSADGAVMHLISVEMSETGMSAMVKGSLTPGETVELEPVAGDLTPAVVRHKLGQLYGFEFVGLSSEQAGRIAENCKKLARYRNQSRGA